VVGCARPTPAPPNRTCPLETGDSRESFTALPGFIRRANLKGKDDRVDWVNLKLNDPERETILCKDPFQAHDERVERLIRSF
jgi:hypothetical protein